MARISQSYKSMLLAVLPLAVANSEAEHAVLAGIVDSLALIDEKAKAGRRAYYLKNAEAIKAKTAKWHKENNEKANATRRARYLSDGGHRKAKTRGYAATQRAKGNQKEYAKVIKKDGRSRVYQARYKFGEYAEAALILHAIESAPTQPIKGIEHV